MGSFLKTNETYNLQSFRWNHESKFGNMFFSKKISIVSLDFWLPYVDIFSAFLVGGCFEDLLSGEKAGLFQIVLQPTFSNTTIHNVSCINKKFD